MSHPLSKLTLLGTLVALLWMTMPAHAVKNFKTSRFGNARQVWFEVEDYDERSPDTDQYYPVVDAAGAFGKAITRAGGAGGMIRWTFDISAAGGKGGTWYFWGRIIDPGNTSDYMLVEGDPGDPVIPKGPPFPGGSGAAPFVDADDRIFEGDYGPPWAWGQGWDIEGHTKELRDGENSMYIFHRQGDSTVFWDVFVWTDSPDYVPTDADYQNATPVLPDTATNPSPASGATDVPRDVVLSWSQGDAGTQYDVYVGTSFDAVDQATAATAGIYRGRIDPNTYAIERLAFGQTCFWRVDKVTAAPESKILKGSVWSFTAESYAYPVTTVTATASSAYVMAGQTPAKTIDGSGLNADDQHSNLAADQWLTAMTSKLPAWIQYDFDQVYVIQQMKVWNSNQTTEPFVGFGAKSVLIECSLDGATWTPLNTMEFAQADGSSTYGGFVVDMGAAQAKSVRLTIQSNWSPIGIQATGLSEVRFYYVPVKARLPQPASGATGVSVDALLSWRAGREAASHRICLGTEPNAGDLLDWVNRNSYDPGPLNFGQTYYWQVSEVNEAKTPWIWEGDIWSFSTSEYSVVDDFESYTNESPNRVFQTWIDGWGFSKDDFFPTGNPGNGTGAMVGYDPSFGTIVETVIVHTGDQSMPVEYNNVNQPYYSEVERTWDESQDWTGNGADTLVLWFRGNPVGFLETAPGSITMSGTGADIWNAADEFRFAYKRLSGNGVIIAKVDSLANTDPWAKAGVMIRESLDPDSRYAIVLASPGNGVHFQARLMTAAAAVSDTTAPSVPTAEQLALTTPVWVKLERTGGSFNGFYSTDGVKWTTMTWSPQTINMIGSVYVGLAVTSHNTAAITTAQFSGVSATGGVTGPWETEAVGVAQPANAPASVYVAVQDSAGKTKVIAHPDPAATTLATWQEWRIALSEFSSVGVRLDAVKKLFIGVGDRANPRTDGAGRIFIDDIGVGHPAN